MHSEFYNVALDRIRYSLVWEDSYTLYQGLQIKPADQVLVITSAGCNVLNTLLANPRQVTAIDLNPVQNKLLLFKKHLIEHYPHAIFRALLGLDGSEQVRAAWRNIAPTLPDSMQTYWSSFFDNHPGGLLIAGKLEAYITGFYHMLDPAFQEKLQQLIQFDDVAAQKAFFFRELDNTDFQKQFISYFDEENLSKGRDPKLFKYALESGGEAFYRRLSGQIASTLVKNNFFFRFFFFGPQDLPQAILPPCYQAHNYEALRRQLPKLQVVTGEAIDYLLSEAGQNINKATLSNIFEYTSPEEFEQVNKALFADHSRQLCFIYWNLLQEQGPSPFDSTWTNSILSNTISQEQACFYFRDVRMQAATGIKRQTIDPPLKLSI